MDGLWTSGEQLCCTKQRCVQRQIVADVNRRSNLAFKKGSPLNQSEDAIITAQHLCSIPYIILTISILKIIIWSAILLVAEQSRFLVYVS